MPPKNWNILGRREEPAPCPACGHAIETGHSAIRVHGVALHLKCAVYRRRELTR